MMQVVRRACQTATKYNFQFNRLGCESVAPGCSLLTGLGAAGDAITVDASVRAINSVFDKMDGIISD